VEEQITSLLSGLHFADPDRQIRPAKTGLIPALILSFLFLAISIHAASDQTDNYSPEKILLFTGYLVEKGEYYRAWTELRRLESYYPGYISRENFDVTALYLMYKGKRYAEIPEFVSGKDAGCAAGIIVTDSFIMLGDYNSGFSYAEKYSAVCSDDMLSEFYSRRKAYISIATGDIYKDGILKPELSGYRELIQYRDRMHDTRKSPALAALLGVFPGAGYIYSGDEGTGFVAMTVIAVFGAVTYGSYENGIEPLAILSGAVTLFFYGGNIAGGYLEAKKYNTVIDHMIEKKARSVLALDNDIDRIYIRFGISSNGK